MATARITRLSVLALLLFAVGGKAQEKPAKRDQTLIDRGKYIVENVAMCERCHTQRDERGNPDRSNWLMGGPVQTQATYSAPTWASREPRIAGTPPGTDAEFIRLMMTGISRTGKPPDLPMPPFRMTRADAEAVLAYLKSLR